MQAEIYLFFASPQIYIKVNFTKEIMYHHWRIIDPAMNQLQLGTTLSVPAIRAA